MAHLEVTKAILKLLGDGRPRARIEIFHGIDTWKPSPQALFWLDSTLAMMAHEGKISINPCSYQLASAAKPQQSASTAADLLAIERSLNEGLRAEVDLLIKENTKAAQLLTAAMAMLTPEQQANLITTLQEAKP